MPSQKFGDSGVATTIAGSSVATGSELTVPDLVVSGLTGATSASRLVGATAGGAPASGTFAVGDVVVDQLGAVWVCVTAGSPGTWRALARSRTDIMAAAEGIIAESWPRQMANAAVVPTSQVLYAVGIPLRKGEIVSNVLFGVTIAGTSTAPTLIKGALLDSTGKVLNQSANVASGAQWTSKQIAVVPLGGTVTIPSDGLYYAAFLKNGAFAGTDMQIGRITLADAVMVAPIGSGSIPMASQAAQTDFQANNSSQTLTNGTGTSFWAAVT